MSNNVNLKEYLPNIYNGIIEAETQQDALSIEINKMHDRYELALMDQFVQFASIQAIAYYENIFNILANPELESLDFRRQRILSRMKSLRPPYTYWYLRIVLDEIFGEGNYILDVDSDGYLISLQSSAKNSLWYHELRVTISTIKPCNMIFENIPLVDSNLFINERILSSASTRNYKLNGTWQLGIKPFTSKQSEEIRKMENVPSIQPEFIEKSLQYWKTIIHKIKINNIWETEDLTFLVQDNMLNIEYQVLAENISNINNIKILDEQENILSDANVYIPVEDFVVMKHRIKLEEGINE